MRKRQIFKKTNKRYFDNALLHGLFDPEWYQARYGKFENDFSAFEDYLNKSRFSNASPSVNFDTEFYHRHNTDVYYSNEGALQHYLNHGMAEGRMSAPFSLKWQPKHSLVATDCSDWNKQKIAICLHIFYDDFVDKFAESLKGFPTDIDVFVGVSTEAIKNKANKVFNLLANVNKVTVVVAPNRGRNFGPLLVEFSEQLLDYDLFCHIHSKKSLFSGREQTQWFDYLNQYLLKDNHVINCMLRLFKEKQELGVYYPTSFWMMPSWINHWTCNKPFAQGFVDDWGIDLSNDFLAYPAGGMFWARPSALKQLLDGDYQYEDFPEEPLPNDGSWLHALERSVGLLAEKNKFNQFFYYPPTGQFTLDQSFIIQEYAKTPESMTAELASFDIVSFDVFDTIIRRRYTVADYAKLKLGQELSVSLNQTPEHFVEQRNQTEFEIRQKKSFKGDVCITEIYEALAKIYSWTKVEQSYWCEQEFQYDLDMIEPKFEMVEMVNGLHDLGKKIWFITDIYYTQNQVARILAKVGVGADYRLFVSSHLGLRKDSGTMWQYITQEVDKLKCSFVHVGDNVRSDAQICGDYQLPNMHILHPYDKWRAAGFADVLTGDKKLNEANILKWGKLVSNFGRYPFMGE